MKDDVILCGWCIGDACTSASHLPIHVFEQGSEVNQFDPRHTTIALFETVTGYKVNPGYVNVPPGVTMIRWLAYKARTNEQVEMNNNRYRPVAITTVDGLPVCELHAMTAIQRKALVRDTRRY